MMDPSALLPGPTDTYPWVPDPLWPVLAPYWEGLRAGELRFPRCQNCGRFQWYPQPVCPACRGMDFVWEEAGFTGTIFSFVVLHRPFIPTFGSRLPLTVALIDIDGAPGVRLVTNVVGEQAHQVEIGCAAKIFLEEVHPSVVLPFVQLVP